MTRPRGRVGRTRAVDCTWRRLTGHGPCQLIGAALIGAALASPCPAGAAEYLGKVRVIDGDTIEFAGKLVRLWGIDAPERSQLCWRDGEPWACGEAAADALDQLIGGSRLVCIGVDVDRAGTVHAFCRTEHDSINASMVREGWALDDSRRSGGAYARLQAEAKAERRGLWASEFDLPWKWRQQIEPALITIAFCPGDAGQVRPSAPASCAGRCHDRGRKRACPPALHPDGIRSTGRTRAPWPHSRRDSRSGASGETSPAAAGREWPASKHGRSAAFAGAGTPC